MGFCLDFGVFYASAVLIATRTFIILGMEIDQGGRIRNVKLMDSGISDYWAIARLEKESFGEDAWTALDMIPVLLNGDIFRCKAVSGSDGRLIAFAAAEFNRSAKTAFLLTIAVAAEARRRGLGSLLLRGCECACSERFAGGRMKLTVSTVNNAAIALYRKHGYRRVGELSNYYGEGRDAYLMERSL